MCLLCQQKNAALSPLVSQRFGRGHTGQTTAKNEKIKTRFNMNTEPKFWQGTNFWIALILAVGGLFVGFPEGEARAIVAGLFGLVAAAGAFREKLKGVTVVPWRDWLRSPNTWNYIAAAVTATLPALPVDFFQRLRDLIDALLGGNWQGVVTAVFSIATMLYYIIRGNGAKPAASK